MPSMDWYICPEKSTMRSYDPSFPLFSLHIPKCAGSSLRQALTSLFPQQIFFHYYQTHNRPPRRQDLPAHSCIHGHFNRLRGWGVLDTYPEATQYITVLRHPLAAAVSNYHYWKQKARTRQLVHGLTNQTPMLNYSGIDDFFEKRPRSNLLDFFPWPLTQSNFRDLLERHFVWIGLTEYLDDDIRDLAALLGKPVPLLPVANASSHDEVLSPLMKERFLQMNELEIAIYDHVQSKRRAAEPKTRIETP